MNKVKASHLDLVFDRSGMSLNGVPVVMFAPENWDFTTEVLTALNKNVKPAASASPAKP